MWQDMCGVWRKPIVLRQEGMPIAKHEYLEAQVAYRAVWSRPSHVYRSIRLSIFVRLRQLVEVAFLVTRAEGIAVGVPITPVRR